MIGRLAGQNGLAGTVERNMRLSSKQINKTINYVIFMAAYFMQVYVDGRYIAHGQEPTVMKVLKYALVALGIFWGLLQLYGKRRIVFLRELCNILLTVAMFLIVSLFLILLRDGDLGLCLDYTIRYSMSVLYAFVLLNTLDFDDVYRLMTYALAVSVFGFFLETGNALLNWSLYSKMSFSGSYSPFESHYFAAPSINCCAFFLYYRKNKLLSVISFIFVLLTFKRPQIIAAVIFLVMPLFVDPNKKIKKSTHTVMCVATVLCTILWYYFMMPECEWIIEAITGQSTEAFTSGRSSLLRDVVSSSYKMAGLGSSSVVIGRTIEMDLVMFMLEMSLPVMAIFVFCFASLSGRRIYAVAVMAYRLFSAMTGSGLYNITGMLLLYLFFGSVNYLQPDKLKQIERKWIRIKFR